MGKPDLEKWLDETWPTTGQELAEAAYIKRTVAREFFDLIEWAMEETSLHDEDEPECYGCRGRRILRDLGIEP